MTSDLEKLIELQEADAVIGRLREEVAALPRRVAAIEAKLAGTRTALDAARASLKAGETNRRKHESEISDLRLKISKYRDQSLAVKTNEAYRALMHEIGFADKDIAALEDKILDSMVETEAREKELKQLEIELKAETAEVEKEKADARSRTAEDEAQLATWNAKRDALRAAIQEHVVRHYDRVMRFRGSGIAEVIGHKCAACQVVLRPQVFNDVKTNEQIVTCDSCQRILYFVAEHQPAEEAEPVTNGRQRRAAPQKAWYFLPDFQGTPALAAFINGKSNCSMRVFDAERGHKLQPTDVQPGEYKAAFSQWVAEGTRLRASLHDAHLEEWGEQLPDSELSYLRAALHEAQAGTTAAPEENVEKEEPAPQA